MYFRRITKNAFWLVLLPSTVWALSETLSISRNPSTGWMGDTSFTQTSNVTFTIDKANWNTLSITANGLSWQAFPPEQDPSSWQVDTGDYIYPYTGAELLPVIIPLDPNRRYSITVSPTGKSNGMQFKSAVVSGPDVATAVTSSQTTTHLQEPLMTSSPTASLISSTSQSRSTVTVLGSTSTITAPNSQASGSTASMQTLGNPYVNMPQNSVSLTNSDPSLSNSTENLATTNPTNYSAIVGGVLGTLAGVALCFLATFLYYRKRQKKRIPPSMAYMNYRSATEQPPRWNLHRDRTAFKDAAPVMVGGTNRAGIGAGGGLLAAKRVLSPLDERSAEGSIATHSPSPHPPQASNPGTIGAANGRYPSLDSTVNVGMARTISQPSSAEHGTHPIPASQLRPVSVSNSTAYDGVEPYGGIEPTPHSQRSNPFDDHFSRHV